MFSIPAHKQSNPARMPGQIVNDVSLAPGFSRRDQLIAQGGTVDEQYRVIDMPDGSIIDLDTFVVLVPSH